jgi:predicted DNA-binding transcriptional regulator YafY
MADRVERLTNLLALLLETVEPMSLIQIAAELDGQYPAGEQARRASFERDKAALRSIGVPIETEIVAGGAYAGQTRYWIDRRAYELADLALDDDEVRALQVAVATVRTGSSLGRDAIWKLGGAARGEAVGLSASLPEQSELPVLRAAVASRSVVHFGYRGAERTVDPWGLLLRGGFWYLLGFDHDRGERRTFRVDRFAADSIVTGQPGSFARPASFDPRDAFPADPKQITQDAAETIDAVVRIDAARATAIVRELGEHRVLAHRPDGGVDVAVPASNLEAFRSWLIGLLDHAVVVSPAHVRRDVMDWLGVWGRR